MKTKLSLPLVWAAMSGMVLLQPSFLSYAQEATPAGAPPAATPPAEAPPANTPPPANLLTAAQLDEMLAPIALYPDPLLAQILPAATIPQDVVLAHRYILAKKDPALIDQQPWNEAAKALARYPDVLKMMDDKLDWTTALGQAYLAQPDDVFASVQHLRAQAEAVGNLKSTPQQTIVQEKEVIKIMPADPQVIYVPTYQPTVIYTQPAVDPVVPLLTFGAGLAIGAWLSNDCDDYWYGRAHYYGGYHGGNYYGGNNTININNNNNVNIGNGNGNHGGWNGGKPGNGNGGWNGNKPGNGNGGWNGNKPGNGNGGWNGNKPGNGNGNGQRPGNGAGNGNRPGAGGGGQQKPGAGNRPGSGAGGQQKPSTRPAGGSQQKPSTRPSGGGQQRPSGFGGGSGASREGSKSRPADMGNRGGGGNRSGGNRGGSGGGGGNRGGGGGNRGGSSGR